MNRLYAVAMAAFLAVTIVPLTAQEESGRVFLDSGPTRARGLRFLPVNVLPHYRGEYRVPEGVITVYYTDREVAVYPSWKRIDCSRVDLLRIPYRDAEVIAYLVDNRSWDLFFSFPPDYGDVCLFVTTFVSRFLYFLQADTYSAVPPFPAILELR